MQTKNSTTLYCFSPAVIAITFVFEITAALYTLVMFARKTVFGRLAATFLFCLAFFQISELLICAGVMPELWARLGYVSITFLPILSYHMITKFTHRSVLMPVGYTAALALSLYIFLSPELFRIISCTGQYVAFTTDTLFTQIYAVFYIGLLLAGLVQLAMNFQHKEFDQYLIGWFTAAYLSFMFPMAVIYYMVESARIAVPSIMCGFALLAALIVFAKILPYYDSMHQKKELIA